jgi:REP element-mobilizing transposase RayT
MPDIKRRLPSPPKNPGLRNLVAGKLAWDGRTTDADKRTGFRGWHERGYVPHRDSPGLTQFVTYRLADSFPVALRAEWSELFKIENDLERRKELESYLDRGRGECWLRRPEIAQICQRAFRHFDGKRYELKAWCLMPNHVHVLVKLTTTPMAEFVQSWKGYTSRLCNRILKRCNVKFWADGYWDTYMRDSAQELRTIRYIEENPVKAGLVPEQKSWLWSSATFRDEYGVLRLPKIDE